MSNVELTPEECKAMETAFEDYLQAPERAIAEISWLAARDFYSERERALRIKAEENSDRLVAKMVDQKDRADAASAVATELRGALKRIEQSFGAPEPPYKSEARQMRDIARKALSNPRASGTDR